LTLVMQFPPQEHGRMTLLFLFSIKFNGEKAKSQIEGA